MCSQMREFCDKRRTITSTDGTVSTIQVKYFSGRQQEAFCGLCHLTAQLDLVALDRKPRLGLSQDIAISLAMKKDAITRLRSHIACAAMFLVGQKRC
jgi:hypothetical protein